MSINILDVNDIKARMNNNAVMGHTLENDSTLDTG